MNGNLVSDGPRVGRRGHWLWLPALVLAAGGIAGAAWALRPHDDTPPSQDNHGAVAPGGGPGPVVVCLGMADFEGGVLSLRPTVPGRIVEVKVAENESVPAGGVLLRLDDQAAHDLVTEAEAALESAEARLVEARKAPQRHKLLLAQQKAVVAAARHELAASRFLVARQESLVKNEVLNPKQEEATAEEARKAQATVEAEQARLDALALVDPQQAVRRAEADVRARRAALDLARHALREHVLRAPLAGMVLRLLANPGEEAGPQSPQPALLFAPDRPMIIRAEVTQEFAGQVAVGQRAEATDDAIRNGPVWRGRVTRLADWFSHRKIVPENPIFQDVRTLQCIVHLDADQPPLRVGQRLRVKFFER
jgi:HlyD family secretion protein